MSAMPTRHTGITSKYPPAFILSCHRSGSTLLARLLDAHPNIACPPETKFLCALERFLDYPQVPRALSDLGLSKRDIYSHLRSLADGILESYVHKQSKLRWVDKTPNHYRLLPFLTELYQGEAKIIVLVRHPLDTIESLISYFHLTPTHEDPDIAGIANNYGRGRVACAQYWRDVYEEIDVGISSHAETMLVQYEKLVTEPDLTLERICTFLGETLSADQIKKTFQNKKDIGYGDRKFLRTESIQSDRIDIWTKRPALETQALWRIVGDLATMYGYSADR